MTDVNRLHIDPGVTADPAPVKTSGLSRAWWVDIAAMALLFGAGAQGFARVFDSTAGYRAAAGGLALGLLIAVAGAWRRLGTLTTAGIVALAYFACGTALAVPSLGAANVVPTLASARRLLLLSVQGWRDLLTVSIPADDFVGPPVVPFLAALVLSTIATSVALRSRRYLMALIPAALFLIAGILWGSKADSGSAVQGVIFSAVALAWGAWRGSWARTEGSAPFLETDARVSQAGLRRGAAGVLTIIGTTAIAALLAPAWGGTVNRHILRDDVVPPFDPQAFASPLSSYRFLETEYEKDVLLTVTGLPEGARVHLATLDTYDGDVYNVDSSSAHYVHIGSRVDVGTRRGSPTRLGVEIGKYSGIWLPGGGDIRGLKFVGNGADSEARGVYYNAATGTALTTVGVRAGTKYVVDVVLPVRPTEADIEGATLRNLELPANQAVPEVIASSASEYAGEAGTPFGQLVAMSQRLRSEGFYSNGKPQPSRSGHTSERIAAMLAQPSLVGDDEQYAVLMALMARSLGYPARVVMGFYPSDATARDGDRLDLTGADAHVWVEVAAQPDQWVAFDPTPERDRTPQVKTQKPRTSPIPQVLSPPEPPRSDANRPLDYEGVAKPPEPAPENQVWRRIARFVAIGLGAFGVLAGPMLLILLAKGRRRRRRLLAPSLADRVSGSWEELRDASIDLGAEPTRISTRAEHAVALLEHFPQVDARGVARGVDGLVFGPTSPSEDDVHRMWREIDDIISNMRGNTSRRKRLRSRVSMASLRPPRVSTTTGRSQISPRLGIPVALSRRITKGPPT